MIMSLENPKLRFLIDECVSISVADFISKQAIHSTEILPHGAPDDIVFSEANKMDLVIVTADHGLILRALVAQKSIIFQNPKGERYHIQTELIEKRYSRKSISKTTQYLLLNEEVIFP